MVILEKHGINVPYGNFGSCGLLGLPSTMSLPLPSSEDARLNALRRYDILDTGAEQAFDDITLLASQICGTNIAMISLVDRDRQWFKSKVGMTTNETPRDMAVCEYGILNPGVMVVEDTLLDERFAANPLVTGASEDKILRRGAAHHARRLRVRDALRERSACEDVEPGAELGVAGVESPGYRLARTTSEPG